MFVKKSKQLKEKKKQTIFTCIFLLWNLKFSVYILIKNKVERSIF